MTDTRDAEAQRATTTELAKAYAPAEFEGAIYERWLAADVFAPDGAGSTRRRRQAAVHDHPAAAERHRLAPPRPRPARHGRGPDGPPRPDAGHGRRCSCRVSTTPRSPPSSSSTGSSPRRARAGRAWVASATWSGCARSSRRPARSSSASSGGSARRSTGAGSGSRWTRARRRPSASRSRRLYDRDLAYRTEALVNWCPGCRTSVSDLEVISTPETGTLWSVRYHLVDEATGDPTRTRTITVATTRPETILGDTAVAVHPDDARYRDLVGRRVRIPFVERDVPIIADEVVDPAFGTGAVKITPAHDHDDHEMGLRHGLPMPTILDDDAAVIANTGTAYDGLDRYAARSAILADLEARGDLVGGGAPRDGPRALPALERRHRAASQDPVVRPDGAARGGGPGGDAGRPDRDRARRLRQDLGALADDDPRLERLPPAVVGPPDPGLVLPGRPRHGQRRGSGTQRLRGVRAARGRAPARTPTSSTRGSARGCGRSRPWAGPTTPPTTGASTRRR